MYFIINNNAIICNNPCNQYANSLLPTWSWWFHLIGNIFFCFLFEIWWMLSCWKLMWSLIFCISIFIDFGYIVYLFCIHFCIFLNLIFAYQYFCSWQCLILRFNDNLHRASLWLICDALNSHDSLNQIICWHFV